MKLGEVTCGNKLVEPTEMKRRQFSDQLS